MSDALPSDTATDQDLIERFKAGDAAAFEAFYRRYRAPVRRLFAFQGAACEGPERFWQEVIRAAVRGRLGGMRPTHVELYRLAVQSLPDRCGGNGRRAPHDQLDNPIPVRTNGSDAHLSREPPDAHAVALAVGRLPEAERVVWLLHVDAGLSETEAAQALEADVAFIGAHLRAARALLRRSLERPHRVIAAE